MGISLDRSVSWLPGFLISSFVLIACSKDPTPPAGFPDATVEDPDGGTPIEGPKFTFEVVAGSGSEAIYGDNAVLALTNDGRPAIAYGTVAAGSTVRELWVAERMNDGTWSAERAVIPGANAPSGGDSVGLGFGYVGAVPHLAYIGGDGDGRPTSPFPTDLMLSTKSGGAWSERTLVDTSGEAIGECPVGTQDYCNFGGVVGTHASLATKTGGFAVVYRDTHNGFAADDYRRSDTEVYAEGGPFTNSNVDPDRGTGAFGDIAWLPNGNLVVAYNLEADDPNEDRLGVWAAVYDGTTWQRSMVSSSQTAARVSLAVDANGTIWLAFYQVDASALLVTSSSDGLTWNNEIVDEPGYTGIHPSLAIDNQGRPVVAYTDCGTRTGCPGTLNDASVVKLARKEGAEWKIYLADDGEGNGYVGLFNSIVVLPDGKLAIAFQHSRFKDLIFLREQ